MNPFRCTYHIRIEPGQLSRIEPGREILDSVDEPFWMADGTTHAP